MLSFKRILVPLLMVASAASAGPATSSQAKSATALSSRKSYSEIRRKDQSRDARSHAKPLPKGRTVYRYTTKKRAGQESSKGIPAGAHMTSRGVAGRPASAGQAQREYGLPRKPEVRETVRLPQGQPSRLNKVYGGKVGEGELTSTRRVPSKSVQKVVPLKK
jgi:Ni/Co efflux regulator RcnB